MEQALIYMRVSTGRQADEGWSLDAQEKYCRKYAEQNNYTVVDVYREEGKSGTNTDRPALKDLLARCQSDKTIKAVLVQETDRLARNTGDHIAIKAILKKANVKLISVAQPMLDDSPEGNMIDTIIASVNQFQSDINSRKTKKGMQERFNSGWWPALAKLGYLNQEVNGDKIIVSDPARWHLIKEGLKMYLTGDYSGTEISDSLYENDCLSRNGKKICDSEMVMIIKDPFYAGIMKWNGQEKKGRHEPMISIDEHQQILAIMDAHNYHACRRRIHNFLLRGFVFCGICGQRYTAEKHRIGKNPNYYHCGAEARKHSNKNQNIETAELERQVEEKFKAIEFSQEFIDKTIEKVKVFYNERVGQNEKQKRILLNKKMKIEGKRQVAEEKLVAGTLEDDDFKRMRDRYKNETGVISTAIEKLENRHEIDVETAREALLLSKNVYKAYKNAAYEAQRLYLSFFWDKFLVRDKKIVEAQPSQFIVALLEDKKVFIAESKNRMKIKNPMINEASNVRLLSSESEHNSVLISPSEEGEIRLTSNMLRW